MNDIISVENFGDENIAEQTNLTQDAAAGQAVINVENTQVMTADEFLLVGNKGQETGQIQKISSIADLAVTLNANLKSKHYRNEAVYKLRGDQAKIYKAANVSGAVPAVGDFTILATVTLEGDQLMTNYVDTNGGSDYWYIYTYYNSFSGFESSKSTANAKRGGNYGMYATVEEVRAEAGMESNRWITDQAIDAKLVAAQSEVNSILSVAGYTLPLASVPEVVRHATILLAAGYLLLAEYGPEHTGTNKEGNQKIAQARAILEGLKTDENVLIIDGVAVDKTHKVSGYPDSGADDAYNNGGPKFTMDQEY